MRAERARLLVVLYEYQCLPNGHRFEVRHPITQDPVAECPVCGGAVRRVIHPVGIVFKGSGFYATDSRGKGANSATKSADSSAGDSKSDSSGSQMGESKSDAGKADSGNSGKSDKAATSAGAASSSSSSSGSGESKPAAK